MANSPGLFSLGFNPLSISGCKLWIRSDSLALADGAVVSTWRDQSGLGNHVTQGTPSAQPVYHTNIINGLPAVLFDGAAATMQVVSGQSAQPVSVFTVIQPTANTASQISYACVIINELLAGLFIVVRLTTNFWGTFTTGTGDLSSGNALVSGTPYLLEMTAATTSTFLYQRGVQVATRAETVLGNNGSAAGLGNQPGQNRWYKGYIAEVLIYNTVLSSTDRVNVENYLIGRYAL